MAKGINCGVFDKGVCDDCHNIIKGPAFIFEGGKGARCKKCWLRLIEAYPEEK